MKICFLIAVFGLIFSSLTYAEMSDRAVYAQLKGKYEILLSSELSARVNYIKVRDGEYFNKGDILIQFDCALEEAKLEKAKIVMKSLQRMHKVQQRLLKLNSTGNLEAEMAAVNVAKARADINIQSVIISKCNVIAPFSGRVINTEVEAYEFVSAGRPLLQIIDSSALEIEFLAPSSWLQWIKPGSTFSIKINETSSTHKGEVTRTGAQIDPVTHSIKIYGKLSAKNNSHLIAGMTGKIIIPDKPSLKIQ
jgi:membrane fusion protein, multidrug efflux system